MCLAFDKAEALAYHELMINMLSVSPDDMPVIGNLRQIPNAYLNIGHGQRTTALAMVSGKLLNKAVEGEQNDLSPRRFKI